MRALKIVTLTWFWLMPLWCPLASKKSNTNCHISNHTAASRLLGPCVAPPQISYQALIAVFSFLVSLSFSLSPYLPPSLPFSLLSCNFLCSRHWPRTPAPPPPKYWDHWCEPPRPVFQGSLLDSGSMHFSVSLGFLVRPLLQCEIQGRSPVQRWKEMTFTVSWLPCCMLSLQECIGEKKWKDSEQILY